MSINWPTAQGLDAAIKLKPSNPDNYLGAQIVPMVTSMFQRIRYNEIYQGTGMTTPTALEGDLKLVAYPKIVEKEFEPAYFREGHEVNEKDILELRKLEGNADQRATIDEIIKIGIDNLNIRIDNRVEWARWQALLTGAVSIDENGIVYTADYGIPAANLAKTVSVAWTSPDTAIPMTDLMQALDWYSGTGYRLGEISMNSVTAKYMVTAKDTKSYYKGAGIHEQATIPNLVKYWSNFFPGVKLNIYDEGYINSAGSFTKFIADNYISFLPAAQPGEVADFVAVPNAYSNSRPGKFLFAIDETKGKAIPKYTLVGGVFGGVRVKRPGVIFKMDVTQT